MRTPIFLMAITTCLSCTKEIEPTSSQRSVNADRDLYIVDSALAGCRYGETIWIINREMSGNFRYVTGYLPDHYRREGARFWASAYKDVRLRQELCPIPGTYPIELTDFSESQ